jgi:predicted small secreted protein
MRSGEGKMKKTLLVLFVAFVSAYGSGCATIATGKYQDIVVTSDPSGAEVTSSTGRRTITPGTLTLRRSEPCVLVARLEGHPELQRHLTRTTEGWVWGNILLGGVVGVVVDVASGSHKKIKENEVFFDFEKAQRAAEPQYTPYRPRPKEEPVQQEPTQRIEPRILGTPEPGAHSSQQRPRLVVKGIVYSERNPSALVGKDIVHEGDTISGAQVVKIRSDSVEFSFNGTTWRQSVSR